MPQLDTVGILNNGILLFWFFTISSIFFIIMPLYLLFTYIKLDSRKIKNNCLSSTIMLRKFAYIQLWINSIVFASPRKVRWSKTLFENMKVCSRLVYMHKFFKRWNLPYSTALVS